MRGTGRFAAAKLSTKSCRIILAGAREIRRNSDKCQACIAAHGETEQTDPALIDGGFVFPVLQQEIEKADHIRGTGAKDGQVVASRGIFGSVAGMIDRCDDE